MICSLLGLLHSQSTAMEVYPSNPQADNERPELVDVLPTSLEHLTLLYADARIIPQLQKVWGCSRETISESERGDCRILLRVNG